MIRFVVSTLLHFVLNILKKIASDFTVNVIGLSQMNQVRCEISTEVKSNTAVILFIMPCNLLGYNTLSVEIGAWSSLVKICRKCDIYSS